MTRGGPDYDTAQTNSSVVNYDPSKIIAGLGGTQSVDGSGRPIFVTHFADGAGDLYTSPTSGADAPILTWEYPNVYIPPFGLRVNSGTAYKAGFVQKHFTSLYDGCYGFELGIYLGSSPSYFICSIGAGAANGNKYLMSLYYDPSIKKWYVGGMVGPTIYLDDWSSSVVTPGWISVKIVANFQTAKMVKAVIGNRFHDLSSYSMDVQEVLNSRYAYFNVDCRAYAVPLDPITLGYIIITSDEPY